MRKTGVLLLVVLFAPMMIFAGNVGVTAKAGTLGVGADLTLKLGELVNLRAGYNAFNMNLDVNMDQATVDGKIDLETMPILLDYHPAGTGFRISGGAVINNNKITMTATPLDTFDFNGTDYSVLGLDGSIKFDDLGYYLGVGYGNAVGADGHWHFSCDFGVMYHGEPKVEATASAANAAVQSLLNNDLQEEVNKLQDDIKDFSFYPVISLGVSLTF